MSYLHHEPLGEGLAITILTPLMTYADLLGETSDSIPQSRLLWVLINDVKQRMEETFNVVNSIQPDIRVEVSDVQ